uniref:Uncharacterized protein n=1 Tax=Ditylenchus dipsaci TaxID=166011 RepID=A0A915DPI0_9BILA
MSDNASGSSIRVRFSRLDEESSAILMRSESTIENTTAVIKNDANTINEVETAMEAGEEANDVLANLVA